MEAVAISRNVRISPRKVGLIIESIKHLSIENALWALTVMHKRGAKEIAKTIRSAIANASNNAQLDSKNLMFAEINISAGPALKRFHPSTRGRIHPYKKRSSHIKVILKTRDGDKMKGVK